MSADHSNLPLLRRPLVGITLFYCVGTWFGQRYCLLPLPWLISAAAFFLLSSLVLEIVARLSRRADTSADVFPSPDHSFRDVLSGAALYLAIFLIAWFGMALHVNNPASRALAALMNKPRSSMELIGVINHEPVARQSISTDGVNWTFPLRLEQVRHGSGWRKAGGVLLYVSLDDKNNRFDPVYGERWQFAGVLTDRARMVPGQGGTRPPIEWLRRRFDFRADPDAAVVVSAGHGFPLQAWGFQLRRKCALRLSAGIEHRPDVVGLMRALLLGYRHQLSPELRLIFTQTGTYHIFALSGQHIAILALFIIIVLQARRVCRVKWFFYLAPVLIFFTISTGMNTSAVRGCVMALICFLGPFVGRKPDLPSAMALAALLILVADPAQLFAYGFILSFLIVLGLITICPLLLQVVEKWFVPDPLRVQPEPVALRMWKNALRVVVFLLLTSLAAWLVATPLIAHWFNLVSPIAPLANLVVVPMTTLTMLSGFLSLVSGSILPVLGEVFNFASVVLVSFTVSVTGFLARLPFSWFFVRTPPMWSVLAWYACLLAFLIWPRNRKTWLLVPLVAGLALALVKIGELNRVQASVLNAGGSLVCFIDLPGRNDLCINAGSRYQARKVIRFLRRQGVNRLSALVITRVDAKHAGAVTELLNGIDVKEIWCSSTNRSSKVMKEMLSAARAHGVAIRCFVRGDSVRLPGNLMLYVQHPAFKERYRTLDQAALGLLFCRGNVSLAIGSVQREDRIAGGANKTRAPDIFIADTDEAFALGTAEKSWRLSSQIRIRALARYEEPDEGFTVAKEGVIKLPSGTGLNISFRTDGVSLNPLSP